MNRFEDKVALVTGAGNGIGKACALRIASEGGRVLCVDLNKEAVAATVDEIAATGAGEGIAYTCDVSDEAQVNTCIADCVTRLGSLYVLVNMAGLVRFASFEELTTEEWQKLVDVNLTGTMLMCRAALPHLESSRGSIVNAASTSAHAGLPGGLAYAATKGGVLAMTRTIAVEFAKRGVRANSVSPGAIETAMLTDVEFPPTLDFDLLLARMSSLTNARGPEVVAGVVAMLASQDGIHINGEDIRVDDGTLS